MVRSSSVWIGCFMFASPSQRRAHARPRATTRSITPPTLLHACPERHEGDAPSVQPGAEASGAQADLPASILVPPREASAFHVHTPGVLARRWLDSFLFSRSSSVSPLLPAVTRPERTITEVLRRRHA